MALALDVSYLPIEFIGCFLSLPIPIPHHKSKITNRMHAIKKVPLTEFENHKVSGK
jgi:hypothetical protein